MAGIEMQPHKIMKYSFKAFLFAMRFILTAAHGGKDKGDNGADDDVESSPP